MTETLPCDGCVVCCQKDTVYLHPEMGDDIFQYQKKFWDGQYILEHKKNGDCIYLDRQKGCTIYDRRPYICRNLDCRVWLTVTDEFKPFISKKMMKAAKRMKKKMRFR